MPLDGRSSAITSAPDEACQTVGPSELSNPRAPEWMGALLIPRLTRLTQLGSNWDTYGAPPISRGAVAFAAELVGILADQVADLGVPNVAPMSSGGVELEWSAGELYASLEINPAKRSWGVAYSTPAGEGEELDPADIQPFITALRELVSRR